MSDKIPSESPIQDCQSSLVHRVSLMGWKDKIQFFDSLLQTIQEGQLQILHKIFQNSYVQFLKENNVNVLLRIVATLKAYLTQFGFENVRAQRQIIKSLVGLAKMKKTQFNAHTIQIIVILLQKEKKYKALNERQPLSMISTSQFNSLNNPTFLTGNYFGQANEQNSFKNSLETDSFIVEILVQIIKGCRQEELNLILELLNQLSKVNILTQDQLQMLSSSIAQVFLVIGSRKVIKCDKNISNKSVNK